MILILDNLGFAEDVEEDCLSRRTVSRGGPTPKARGPEQKPIQTKEV
jgi:hypothetical protein